MEEPRERLVRYVDDAHAAEVGIAEMLQTFLDEARSESARNAYQEHLMQTKDQALRLEKRLRELGSQPSGTKSFFNSLLGKMSDILHAVQDANDKTTMDLIRAYSMEHLEIGMYAALSAFARAYGDQDTAGLAEQIMGEEQAAADRIRPLIPQCAAEAFTASMSHQHAA